jgi:hypothetical protein
VAGGKNSNDRAGGGWPGARIGTASMRGPVSHLANVVAEALSRAAVLWFMRVPM